MENFLAFTRRIKKHGTVESTCILCNRTVATGHSIIDLVPAEIAHKCLLAPIFSEELDHPHQYAHRTVHQA